MPGPDEGCAAEGDVLVTTPSLPRTASPTGAKAPPPGAAAACHERLPAVFAEALSSAGKRFPWFGDAGGHIPVTGGVVEDVEANPFDFLPLALLQNVFNMAGLGVSDEA